MVPPVRPPSEHIIAGIGARSFITTGSVLASAPIRARPSPRRDGALIAMATVAAALRCGARPSEGPVSATRLRPMLRRGRSSGAAGPCATRGGDGAICLISRENFADYWASGRRRGSVS